MLGDLPSASPSALEPGGDPGREEMQIDAHPWYWGSVGLRVRVLLGLGPRSLLPTKNSRFCSQSYGSSHVFFKSAFQVDLTFLIDVLSRFTLVAMILSSMSRLFILATHLVLISFVLWSFCWITRLHLRTHIRWADSVRRICRSLTTPVSEQCS